MGRPVWLWEWRYLLLGGVEGPGRGNFGSHRLARIHDEGTDEGHAPTASTTAPSSAQNTLSGMVSPATTAPPLATSHASPHLVTTERVSGRSQLDHDARDEQGDAKVRKPTLQAKCRLLKSIGRSARVVP